MYSSNTYYRKYEKLEHKESKTKIITEFRIINIATQYVLWSRSTPPAPTTQQLRDHSGCNL